MAESPIEEEQDHDKDDVSLILKHFSSSGRAPNNLVALWNETQANNTSTAASFLANGSFNAWYAYTCLKSDADKASHFTGKAACTRLVRKLEQMPPEVRAPIAAELARQITPEKRLENICRKLTGHQTRKRSRLTDDDDDGDASSNVDELDLDTTVCQRSNHATESDDVVGGASVTETTHLFPEDFSEAVERTERQTAFVAEIMMSFPGGQTTTGFACQMTITVKAHKIDYLASILFNMRLETNAGLRYVCLPGGARIAPNPDIIIQDCQLDIISSVFGSETHAGIMANPTYQYERKIGRAKTQCVSMVVSHVAAKSGLVCVNLGLREGALIKAKLYPKYRTQSTSR